LGILAAACKGNGVADRAARVTPEERVKKLRGYYQSLRGQQRVLEQRASQKHVAIDEQAARPVVVEFLQIERDFPGLAPRFEAMSQRSDMGPFYDLGGLQTHLAAVLGRLDVELQSSDATPITEHREFAFTLDPQIRAILERDHEEIQKAFIAGCWKSVIILSGGALEAILLDVVLQNESSAKSSKKAPAKEPDPRKWDLGQMIEVAVDVKLVGPYMLTVSDATRSYRNLVHPGYEVRSGLRFAKEEARIALTVLETIHRDLSR
jgi:hypothetical protein